MICAFKKEVMDSKATSRATISSALKTGKEFGSAWSTRQRTARRKTPHSTVFRRKIHRSPIDSQGYGQKKRVRFEEMLEGVGLGLVSKTWVCHSCSPLFQFRTDDATMKRYSQNLSAFISAQMEKNSVISTEEPVYNITATIEVVTGLAISEDEPEAVRISLQNDENKVVCQALLCSVDVTNEMDSVFGNARPYVKNRKSKTRKPPGIENFLVLPLLLCHGLVRPRAAVIEWLQENFDCNIRVMKFNPIELTWMVSMWTSIQYQPSKKEKKCFFTEFTWKIPIKDIGLDKIQYQLDLQSVKALWDSIERDTINEITLEHVEKFNSAIIAHLTYIFHIRFDALPLMQITAPFVQVHEDGKVKMCSPKYVHTVLAHLSCLAADRLAWT